jgi:copper chaperone
MTCGHCVSSIKKAIAQLDATADVRIDLGTHLVEVTSGQADSEAMGQAIERAGYSPVVAQPVLADGAEPAAPVAPKRRGCGSGCGCG